MAFKIHWHSASMALRGTAAALGMGAILPVLTSADEQTACNLPIYSRPIAPAQC